MKKVILLFILTLSFNINAQEQKFSETDKVLAESLRKAVKLAEKTGDFVIEQAPEVLQEFYNKELFTSIFMIIVSIMIIFICKYIPYLWLCKEKDDYYDDTEKYFNRYGDDGTIAAWIFFIIG